MKKYFFTLILVVCALMGKADADDKLYLYIECSEGQECIDVAYHFGKEESVLKIPEQVLTKESIQSVTFRTIFEERTLDIELKKESATRLSEITRKNKGKNLIVVFNNEIIDILNLQRPITNGKFALLYGSKPFWADAPLFKDLVDKSSMVQTHNYRIIMSIAWAFFIASWIIILLPKLKKKSAPDQIWVPGNQHYEANKNYEACKSTLNKTG